MLNLPFVDYYAIDPTPRFAPPIHLDIIRRTENDAPIRDHRDFAIMRAVPAPGHDPILRPRTPDAGRDCVAKIVRGDGRSRMMMMAAVRIKQGLEMFVAHSR
jgi:hypothetical protein